MISARKPTLKILIIEDDRTSRFVLRRMVEAFGAVEVQEAEDGQSGWDLVSSGLAPDLAFVDLNMPRMNGIEWLRRVRAKPALSRMQVCFCSVVRERRVIAEVASLKPVDYILKPYSREAIQAQIRRVLGVPRRCDSLEPASSVCARQGIDEAGYLGQVRALLEDLRQLGTRLPAMLLQFQLDGALNVLRGLKDRSARLGARRITTMLDGFAHCLETNVAPASSGDGTKLTRMAQFQNCLMQSADTLIQTLHDLRKEVDGIEAFLTPATSEGQGRLGDVAGSEAWAGDVEEADAMIREVADVLHRGKSVSLARGKECRSLNVPIRASILGKPSAETVGALTRKTAFAFRILDPETGKAVEECRKAADLVKLLSFPLDRGIRWISYRAMLLLEAELAARNEHGKVILQSAIGADLPGFLERQERMIRDNLDQLRRQSGREGRTTEEQVNSILDDVRERLEPALNGRLTHGVLYSVFPGEDLSANRDDSRWAGPAALLYHAATLQRRACAEAGFDRIFKFSTFDRQAFLAAMDVFGDKFAQAPSAGAAEEGLGQIEAIRTSPVSEFERCRLIWSMIKGS